MARKIQELGYREVYALEGGFHAWTRAGYPEDPKAAGGMDESRV